MGISDRPSPDEQLALIEDALAKIRKLCEIDGKCYCHILAEENLRKGPCVVCMCDPALTAVRSLRSRGETWWRSDDGVCVGHELFAVPPPKATAHLYEELFVIPAARPEEEDDDA